MIELPDDDGGEEIPPERLVTVNVDGPRKLTDEQRERLKALAALPDDQIDYSDIPEITFIPENVTIEKYFRPVINDDVKDEREEQ